MAAYDDFAWFYNRYWNEEFHSLSFPILERIWLARIAPRARILDVCCGTGYLAGLLATRGHRVTGIDASPSMIQYARENAPAAQFRVSDAAQFQLPRHYDAAISTFDSLNHILNHEQLQAVFRNTAAALKHGAPFVFDMLREEAYQTHWGESFALVRDDHVLLITAAGFDFRSRLAHCTITMFRLLDGVWRRSDAQIQERCYTPEQIDAALRLAGFGEIVCYDAHELGMSGQLGEGRTFYAATRT
ncbi:MAG: class I SAM-dependent methyltransferase [Acidobacteriia bacterium]|nr:class I SAM-dependent methyltransferase [Terriglobia bacterium]